MRCCVQSASSLHLAKASAHHAKGISPCRVTVCACEPDEGVCVVGCGVTVCACEPDEGVCGCGGDRLCVTCNRACKYGWVGGCVLSIAGSSIRVQYNTKRARGWWDGGVWGGGVGKLIIIDFPLPLVPT